MPAIMTIPVTRRLVAISTGTYSSTLTGESWQDIWYDRVTGPDHMGCKTKDENYGPVIYQTVISSPHGVQWQLGSTSTEYQLTTTKTFWVN
jgi:hypothetical protein